MSIDRHLYLMYLDASAIKNNEHVSRRKSFEIATYNDSLQEIHDAVKEAQMLHVTLELTLQRRLIDLGHVIDNPNIHLVVEWDVIWHIESEHLKFRNEKNTQSSSCRLASDWNIQRHGGVVIVRVNSAIEYVFDETKESAR